MIGTCGIWDRASCDASVRKDDSVLAKCGNLGRLSVCLANVHRHAVKRVKSSTAGRLKEHNARNVKQVVLEFVGEGMSGDGWIRDLSVAHKQYAHDAIADWKHKEAVKTELEELAPLDWVCHNATACPNCSEVLKEIFGALSCKEKCVATELASRKAAGDVATENEADADVKSLRL